MSWLLFGWYISWCFGGYLGRYFGRGINSCFSCRFGRYFSSCFSGYLCRYFSNCFRSWFGRYFRYCFLFSFNIILINRSCWFLLYRFLSNTFSITLNYCFLWSLNLFNIGLFTIISNNITWSFLNTFNIIRNLFWLNNFRLLNYFFSCLVYLTFLNNCISLNTLIYSCLFNLTFFNNLFRNNFFFLFLFHFWIFTFFTTWRAWWCLIN